MPPWFPIVVTVILGVLTVVVTAFINITIKFAPDAATAKAELKRHGMTALRAILLIGLVVGQAAMTLYEALSPEPLTGVRVLMIAVGVGTVMLSIPSVMLLKTFEWQTKRMVRLYDHQRLLAARLREK